jgi:hypothetical protein
VFESEVLRLVFGPERVKSKEDGENYIMKSIIIFIIQ